MSIQGYASAASVAPGGAIGLHVDNTPAGADATVTLRVTRLGAPAPMDLSATFSAGHPPTPPTAATSGCGWPRSYTLDVPAGWPSGVYQATVTNADGDAEHLAFVVRARVPGEGARVLLCYPSTTFQAYNDWGGQSLYGDGLRARRVSFDRPGGMGPGRTAPFVRWLAARGIAVDVCASQDLHEDATLLRRYQLFLSSGHDEYWTKEMRDHLEAFIVGGGNAAFFSGNVCFWQARFEDAGRALVCYRDALEDPLAGVDDSRVTVQWASSPVNRPENTLTGVGSRHGAESWVAAEEWKKEGYRVNFPEHWAFEGTGLALGDTFATGAVGYETDAADLVFEDGIARATGSDGTPPTFVVLAVADLRHWRSQGQGGFATMGVYRSAGTVFTVGSTNWADPLESSEVLDRITHNVLTRLSRPQPSHGWESAGLAPGVTAMTAIEEGLVAAGADGALRFRPASGQNLRWRSIGLARGVRALAPADMVAGRSAGLFLVSADGTLWWREAVLEEVSWHRIGAAPGVIALAATEGYLFAVTESGRFLARPGEGDEAVWRDLGSAAGIVAMASINRKLYAATSDGAVLWRQPVREEAAWTWMAAAEGVMALAGYGGRLFGATRAGALLWRDGFA
jgi:hypothetical protein